MRQEREAAAAAAQPLRGERKKSVWVATGYSESLHPGRTRQPQEMKPSMTGAVWGANVHVSLLLDKCMLKKCLSWQMWPGIISVSLPRACRQRGCWGQKGDTVTSALQTEPWKSQQENKNQEIHAAMVTWPQEKNNKRPCTFFFSPIYVVQKEVVWCISF